MLQEPRHRQYEITACLNGLTGAFLLIQLEGIQVVAFQLLIDLLEVVVEGAQMNLLLILLLLVHKVIMNELRRQLL